MATKKGYIVINISQLHKSYLVTQLDAFKKEFKSLGCDLRVVLNTDAYEKISKDKNVKFILFWDKDIALMDRLSNLKIRLFNNLEAISICDDKALNYSRFIKFGVNTPITYVLPLIYSINFSKQYKLDDYVNSAIKMVKSYKLKYPMLVKPRRGSLGWGIVYIRNEKELRENIKLKYNQDILIQQYIGYEPAKDYRVYLINNKVEEVVIRENKKDLFRSNVALGGTMKIMHNPPKALLKEAINASKATKLEFGAIDIVKDKNNKFYVLEVNSNARTQTIDTLTKTSLTRRVCKYILENI